MDNTASARKREGKDESCGEPRSSTFCMDMAPRERERERRQSNCGIRNLSGRNDGKTNPFNNWAGIIAVC